VNPPLCGDGWKARRGQTQCHGNDLAICSPSWLARVSTILAAEIDMWPLYLLLFFVQVFLLLVTEMLIFCALIVPLPFTWRRKLFTFISESPIIAKLQYGMKVYAIYIATVDHS